ncbi:MAG: LysE family translocator [Gammaproteobacteria bacterium]
MEALIGVAGFLVVATATPGPNNLVVMRAAARSGFLAALPAIGGVVIGGLALLVVVITGAGALFAVEPKLQLVVTIGGCLYLVWLAVGLMIGRPDQNEAATPGVSGRLTSGFGGLFVFQFLNPKGWVMLLTAASAVSASSTPGALALLAALFVPISLISLLAWALFGSLIMRCLARRAVRIWFDRAMGCLLLGVVALLPFEM